MARQLTGAGLMIVSGASGAGKSSLLRAGVLPELRESGLRGVPESRSWPCVILSPGHDPLSELAQSVAPLTGADAAAIRRGLTPGDAPGFALTARQAAWAPRQASQPEPRRQTSRQLLLIVDQFEQLFTQCPDGDTRRTFISALHAAAATGADQPAAALVILVVRDDFESRCAGYEELADAVKQRYLLTSMTAVQMRAAIVEPARRAGASVEEGLVDVLLGDAGFVRAGPDPGGVWTGMMRSDGALPLMSHALDQAWLRRIGTTLRLVDYERAGGIKRAVADSARYAYHRLTLPQQAVARLVFTQLTAASDTGVDTACRVTRAELTEGAGKAADEDVEAVLKSFADKRLLTITCDAVEISHEILLTSWPLLRDVWLAETHANRIVLSRLRQAAAEWARAHRNTSYLYRGSLLAAAEETARRADADPGRQPRLTQDVRDFLRASKRARRRRRTGGRPSLRASPLWSWLSP